MDGDGVARLDGDAAIVRQGYIDAGRIVRERASNFYFAFLGQPTRARGALHAIYAFCREADDVTDDGRSPEAAGCALAAMRCRVAEVYEGSPELARDRALQDAVHAFGIRRRDFLLLLHGVERDLTTQRYATFDELYGYCFEVASSVGLLCLPVLGRRDALARRHAIDLGVGMQLTNILRDLAEDGARNRVYVPLADLRRFGIQEGTFTGQVEQGHGQRGLAGVSREADPALDSLVRFEAARARRFLRSGRRLVRLLEPRDRFCPAALQAIYAKLLDRIEMLGGNVLRRRVSLSAFRKAWLAVRAGRASD